MVRDKWIIGVRNKLVNLYMECDSVASIEHSKLTSVEREKLKGLLEKTVKYIDRQLPKVK